MMVTSAGTKAYIGLKTIAGDSDGDDFTLLLGTYSVTFNCKTDEDWTGRRYPPYVSGSYADWLQSLIPYFQKNYIINKYYDLEWLTSQQVIKLIAKEVGAEYTIVFTAGDSNIEEDSNVPGVNKTEYQFYRHICMTHLAYGTLLGEDLLDPDNNGDTFFNIQEYLKHQLSFSFTWPEPTDDFLIKNTECIKQFFVKYAITWENEVKILFSTENTPTYALLGGYDRNTEAILNEENKTWWEKHSSGLNWLTYQPREIYISKFQPVKLSFLIWKSVTSIKLKIKLTFTDGTYTTLSQETQAASQYEVYDAILSYQKLDLASQAKDVASYEVWIADQDDNRLSVSRWFYVDETYREEERIFIFQNSLGRPDVVRFTGIAEKETENTRSTSELISQEGFTWQNFERLDYSNFETQRFTFNTGWLNDLALRPKQFADYLREFYLSPKIYELINNRLYPTRLISKKNFISNSDEDVINIEFEAERAYSDKYFSQDENVHPSQGWDSKFTGNYLNPK